MLSHKMDLVMQPFLALIVIPLHNEENMFLYRFYLLIFFGKHGPLFLLCDQISKHLDV